MALIVQSAGVLADYARTKGRLTTTQVRFLFHNWDLLLFGWQNRKRCIYIYRVGLIVVNLG